MEVSSGGLPSRFSEVNIHRYSPTLRQIIVLVYIQHKFNTISKIVTLFSDEMGLMRHFFSPGIRQEVNN